MNRTEFKLHYIAKIRVDILIHSKQDEFITYLDGVNKKVQFNS